jgi:hypothetical protein
MQDNPLFPGIPNLWGKLLPNPGPLTVMLGGKPIGTLLVETRYRGRLHGRFAPGEGFEMYRPLFEVVFDLDRKIDDWSNDEPCYTLHDQLRAASEKICSLGPAIFEWREPIVEFALNYDWTATITFEEVPEEKRGCFASAYEFFIG